jgi:hypothetical protein
MPHIYEAFKWFEDNIHLFKKLEAKSLLYVGWTPSSTNWWYTEFCKKLSIEKVSVVEVYDANYNNLNNWITRSKYNIKSYCRNIFDVDSFIDNNEYDIIFWDHGPEHASIEDLNAVTPKLMQKSGKALIYSCPWGKWPQDTIGSNTFEKHLTEVTTDMLKSLNLEVHSFNKPDQVNCGELIGVYFK